MGGGFAIQPHVFNELELQLTQELKACKEQIDNGEMMQAIWSTLPSLG